jgi:hypothetical protein
MTEQPSEAMSLAQHRWIIVSRSLVPGIQAVEEVVLPALGVRSLVGMLPVLAVYLWVERIQQVLGSLEAQSQLDHRSQQHWVVGVLVDLKARVEVGRAWAAADAAGKGRHFDKVDRMGPPPDWEPHPFPCAA